MNLKLDSYTFLKNWKVSMLTNNKKNKKYKFYVILIAFI